MHASYFMRVVCALFQYSQAINSWHTHWSFRIETCPEACLKQTCETSLKDYFQRNPAIYTSVGQRKVYCWTGSLFKGILITCRASIIITHILATRTQARERGRTAQMHCVNCGYLARRPGVFWSPSLLTFFFFFFRFSSLISDFLDFTILNSFRTSSF